MYYPYFRGKQYELIAIREQAGLLAANHIIPLIEPVKNNLSSLMRTVDELKENESQFILIVNPKYGDLKNDSLPLFDELITDNLLHYEPCLLGYIADADSDLLDIKDFIEEYKNYRIAIIHYGFPRGSDFINATHGFDNVQKHVFVDGLSGKLYQGHFKEFDRVLLRDGFKKRKNANHPDSEHFSDLHITFGDEGMTGFGDFLIVGDDYMETGGPAYTVAIHLTYLGDDNDMFIYHFKSDTTDTPVDPAGKFFEALIKLVEKIDAGTNIYRSSACDEFIDLYNKGHFPGLGYVKKLSMKHHLELMADFINRT